MITLKQRGAAKRTVVRRKMSTYLEGCLICVWLLCLLVLHWFFHLYVWVPNEPRHAPRLYPSDFFRVDFSLQQPLLWPWCRMGKAMPFSINTPTWLNSMQDKSGLKLTMNAQECSTPPVPWIVYEICFIIFFYLKQIIVCESPLCLITEELQVTRSEDGK